MKIVVCIKQIPMRQAPDTELPLEQLESMFDSLDGDLFYTKDPWRGDWLKRTALRTMFNPGDREATEAALRLREKYGGEVVLMAVGPPRVQRTLRACLAMGADRAVRLWRPALEDADMPGIQDAYTTAQLLGQAIDREKPDLVLCGSCSQEEGSGQVPPILAELLNLPLVTRVVFLEGASQQGKAVVHVKLERGRRLQVECTLPAVFAVLPLISKPRYPGLRFLLKALSEPVSVFEPQNLNVGLRDSRVRLVGLGPPRPRPKKTFNFDSSLSADERLSLIMSGGITEKKSKLWEGDPDELATRLVQVLLQEGYFSPKRRTVGEPPSGDKGCERDGPQNA